MVEIAPGRRLNLRCSGAGKDTVILESGLAFPSYSWRKVQPAVARFARVCSYDRAGLGFSDIGPLPRTAGVIAGDLAALIDRAGLKRPFILVGSSLGSQSVRLLAFRRPADVAGIVLVDPYVEGQFTALGEIDPKILTDNAEAVVKERRCRDLIVRHRLSAVEAEKRGCIASPDPTFSPRLLRVVRSQRLSPAAARTAFSESENLDGASEKDVLRETHSLGAIPIIVLTAGGDFAGQDYSLAVERNLLARLRSLHQDVAGLSTNGVVRVVAGADHIIQASHPAAVIEAIRAIDAKTSLSSPR